MRKLFILLFAVFSMASFAQTDKLIRSITYELGKVEGTIPQINMLMKKGEKIQAREMVDEALKQIEQIEEKQKEVALAGDIEEEDLLITQTQETKRFLINKANQLKNAISIYINCDAKLFTGEYASLKNEIQGPLADFGCSYVENPEQADWVIYVSASAREYNKMELGNFATYFSYVDLQLSIDKSSNGKRVYQNSFSEKGGNNISFERAAQEAYKELSPQISTIIKEYISQ